MNDLTLAGKPVTVLGAGRTGQATARFLVERQAQVFVSDRATISSASREKLLELGIPYEEGGHSERALQAELILPSPGVPYDAPVLQEARRRNIPLMGELELAYRFCKSERIIAVTGTVGKTTTTHLIAELLQAHGYPTVVAGNIGPSLIAQLEQIDGETIVVLEVSSFQLEHVSTFAPRIGVFTRFAPHHLDRHGTLERYFALKCRLFRHQRENDSAIVHRDIVLPSWIRSQVRRFSAEDGEALAIDLPAHQRENVSAALEATHRIDPTISLERLNLPRVLQLPHRLEFIAELNGVRFYNDSKATSVAATRAALSVFQEPLVLILGGYDEGQDPRDLAPAIRTRPVQAVLLWGQTRERWAQALQPLAPGRIHIVRDLHQAVEEALRLRARICLFSPAAPSFDQFQNFEERGEHFRRVVRSYGS
jgi:UDP-N-acetylmuramoylalanine--D-glutamate ligase